MNKGSKISFPVSQRGKNTEGSLGYRAEMRGVKAAFTSCGTDPGQINVLPGSQLCCGLSIIPVLEGLVLVLVSGEAVGNHSHEKTRGVIYNVHGFPRCPKSLAKTPSVFFMRRNLASTTSVIFVNE